MVDIANEFIVKLRFDFLRFHKVLREEGMSLPELFKGATQDVQGPFLIRWLLEELVCCILAPLSFGLSCPVSVGNSFQQSAVELFGDFEVA